MNYKLLLAGLIFLLVLGVTFFVRVNDSTIQDQGLTDSSSIPSQSGSSTSTSSGVNTTISSSSSTTPSTTPSSNTDTSTSDPSTTIITSQTLALHNTQNDCWISYQGKVYDITSFLPNHKGSAGAISPYCGTSTGFEQAFTKQHGTSKVKTLMRVGILMGDFNVQGDLSK